jgi:hypothetical protein
MSPPEPALAALLDHPLDAAPWRQDEERT